jgi:hypothetical protein
VVEDLFGLRRKGAVKQSKRRRIIKERARKQNSSQIAL